MPERFLAIPTQPTCARAWVAAASAISSDAEAYNVVIDVNDPIKFDDRDNAISALVDKFLRDRDLNPISTVTNTLFPESLYRKYGSPRFYAEYHAQVYDKLTSSKQGGRYFERLTRHQDGEGGTYNPLQKMIDKLKTVKESDHQYKSVPVSPAPSLSACRSVAPHVRASARQLLALRGRSDTLGVVEP